MLPQVTLPPSLAMLVEVFGSCFTVPTFATFRVLLAGLIAQTGRWGAARFPDSSLLANFRRRAGGSGTRR